LVSFEDLVSDVDDKIMSKEILRGGFFTTGTLNGDLCDFIVTTSAGASNRKQRLVCFFVVSQNWKNGLETPLFVCLVAQLAVAVVLLGWF
jgi:hypothetical protein